MREVMTTILTAVLAGLILLAYYAFLSFGLAFCLSVVLGTHVTFTRGVALFVAIAIAGLAWSISKREAAE
ncbi:hypothetical protein [Heyndrickxia coagulans]|uniref:hypothetical protein n=1 Tax=Heyndrickxia coagulans TaxID=1398 RepID=UPI000779372D|nr:hypothetical protein [Heyndrickxia coagulans]KYC67211.1 hypothetical protein B4100_3847 [Heyndrickxia coagulans]